MKKNAKSFKRELILSFLTIGLTSIIILGSFQIFQLYSLVKEKQHNQTLSTTFMEDYISSYVENHVQLIETMAGHLSDSFTAGDYESMKERLREIKANYPGFVNLYIGNKEGQSLLFYPDVFTDGVARENYNFSDRSYYQELISSERSVISPVFHGRGGTDLLLITLVSPIFDSNGDIQGYILGGLDLNELDKYTANRITDERSSVIVLDQDNNVVVHPEIDTRTEMENLGDSEIVQQIEENESSGSFTLGSGNDKEYITYGKIDSLGWTVWISSPSIAITGAFIDSIFAVIILALITGTIVIITSLILTNRLETVIQKLLNYIIKYTQSYKNNEAIELTETIQGPTEMKQLLVHFNEMMHEIDENRTELITLNAELETRVKERTANLENKHAELEAVLESMFEGIMLLDNQYQIKYVNEFFLHVISNNINDSALVQPKTLEDVYERFLTYFEVDKDELTSFLKTRGSELKLKYKEEPRKETFYLLHHFSVMSDENRIGLGLLIQDVTKEVEIDTLKNNLISLTSHEFKTPITNIKGSVETLLRKDVEWEPEFQFELLEGVLEDIDRIRNLVNDWMDISKIESGTMYIERNMVRPDHVILESLRMVPKVLQEDASFTFTNETEEGLIFYADKGRIQQVLLNLFTNALRYNDEEHKKIDITLKKEGNVIKIAIADNGIGIAKEHQKSIFNRFYQVDVTATRRSGGTGLGLAICEGIMEAHGGHIEVESSLNRGSTFTLCFPIDNNT